MMLSRPAWTDRFRPGKPRTAVNGFPAAPRPEGPGENRTPVPGFADLCLCRSATGPNQEIVAKLIGRRKVDKNGCWLWTGAINDSGYGAVLAWGKVRYVHRIVGAIFLDLDLDDPSLLVCHACDVRNCFNPVHLWIGSATDNVRDMVEKGRARWTEGAPSEREGERNHQETFAADLLDGLASCALGLTERLEERQR